MRISDWSSDVCSSDLLVREPGHLIDVMPTLVELAGATYPKSFNGHAILPMEGRSMAPAFRGEALTRGKPIFWEHEGNRAVRDRSEEHTSELQSLMCISYAVFCLKKKNTSHITIKSL